MRFWKKFETWSHVKETVVITASGVIIIVGIWYFACIAVVCFIVMAPIWIPLWTMKWAIDRLAVTFE